LTIQPGCVNVNRKNKGVRNRLINKNQELVMKFYFKRYFATITYKLITGLFLLFFSTSFTLNKSIRTGSSANNSAFVEGVTMPYFPLIYTGYGIDHMNINLVNLSSTGLLAGDEVGVFDGENCVGSVVIQDKNIKDNSLSIPASANEKDETNPNGYIDGHKIVLKSYRSGTVYILYFETVNNSENIFERGGSMFALIDFTRSQPEIDPEEQDFSVEIYPNPFVDVLRIEVSMKTARELNCAIYDITGKLVKTIHQGNSNGQQLLLWDGRDNRNHQVSTGIYFCRVNESATKIIFRK
jgi:hypothetical protein